MMNKSSNTNLPTALVAADLCIFKVHNDQMYVYLTTVKNNSDYKGMSCLPGALIHVDETAESAAERVLIERTNLRPQEVYLEQLASFSSVKRDKRSRSVAIAYLGLVGSANIPPEGDIEKGAFVPLKKIKNLAFDHKEIVTAAYERLRNKIHYSTIIKKLLKGKFTFRDFQKIHEVVLDKELDKRNFRKKIMALGLISETGSYKKDGRMRPAMLFTWNSSKVESYDILGFAK